MVTEWQQVCLSLLEIDEWVLCDPAPKIGIYLGTADTPISSLSQSATSLLTALLRYQGLTLSQVQLVTDLTQLHLFSAVWVLGHTEALPKEIKVVMRSESLQTLLAHPIKKKEIAWLV